MNNMYYPKQCIKIILLLSLFSCSIISSRNDSIFIVRNGRFCIAPPNISKGYVIRLPIDTFPSSINTMKQDGCQNCFFLYSEKYDTIRINLYLFQRFDSIHIKLKNIFTRKNILMSDFDGNYFHEKDLNNYDLKTQTTTLYRLSSISGIFLVFELKFKKYIDPLDYSDVSDLFSRNIRRFQSNQEKEELLENKWEYE